MTAAPAIPLEPASSSRRPEVPLLAEAVRRGNRAAAQPGVISSAANSSRGGNAMSTAMRRPHSSRAGWNNNPILGKPKVTVTVARTAGSYTRPLSASMPLGRSTATTGRSASLMVWMQRAAGARGAPFAPVPSTPSRMTAAEASTLAASSKEISGSVLPCSSSGSMGEAAAFRTTTSRPHVCSVRRATTVSPPLCPPPATAAIVPVGYKA